MEKLREGPESDQGRHMLRVSGTEPSPKPSCPAIAVRRTASLRSPMCRASTSLSLHGAETWMAGTSPAMPDWGEFDNPTTPRSIPAEPSNPRSGGTMIIDCHGHYTTEPKDLHRFRKEQTAAANAKDKAAMPSRASLKMSDDEIRESIEQNQLKLQRERGTDLTIFSPRASGMGHHVGDESVSLEWSQICNDLIARVVSLYPKNFIGVCQLPQSPGVAAEKLAAAPARCGEMGVVE